jgi:hypothetical protein
MSNGLGDAKAQAQLKDFTNIFRLDGKVAVVTGGSRGLGLHAASGFVHGPLMPRNSVAYH